jgi:hypothetical protein
MEKAREPEEETVGGLIFICQTQNASTSKERKIITSQARPGKGRSIVFVVIFSSLVNINARSCLLIKTQKRKPSCLVSMYI